MKMQRGLVSTIIPVFNRPQMLREAVQSVLDQHYPNTEIIIVNDGSTDNTAQVIEQLVEKNIAIRAVHIENSGPAIARQRGLEKANGEFIQYLDSDDLLHKDKFDKQVHALNQHQDVGVCYCVQELLHLEQNRVEPAWMRSGEQFNTMFPAMLGGRIWGTPVPLYRTKLLSQAGPWKNLKNQEDWEYDCRVASLNVKLHFINETLVTIRQHNKPHYGQVSPTSKDKLIDKAKSYAHIYEHAKSAKINKNNPEFMHFNRMVFMLVRQCAACGLHSEAKSLLQICSDGTSSLVRRLEYRTYWLASSIIGWQKVGKICQSWNG